MKTSVITLLACAFGAARAAYWPIPPCDSVHPLGNNWGNYQNYGTSDTNGYFHNGIDIITPDSHMSPVVAVAPGWVKAWGTIYGDYHYRLAVCDSSPACTGRAPGWLYAHIARNLPHKILGDHVNTGDTIGFLVFWPVRGFDHLHFARVSDTGATWQRFPNATWWFIQNPLDLIDPTQDTLAPVFENAVAAGRFAFCRDNANDDYLDPDSLSGDVDIIARLYDKTGSSTGNSEWDKLAPYELDYMIRRQDGLVVQPWTVAFQFSNTLRDADVSVVYKYDNTCRSQGDYDAREYFFIITNTDGDSVIEPDDTDGNWSTGLVGDADYWVIVRASDACANTTADSMLVTTANGVSVAERPPYTMLTSPLRATPNPGIGATVLGFGLSTAAVCRLRVFDRTGRIAVEPVHGPVPAGEYRCSLRGLPAGVYLAELVLNNSIRHRAKVVFVR